MRTVNLEKLLPADIPKGERVLWVGRPEPVSLWRRAYRADWVLVWFAIIALWNFAGFAATDGAFAGFVSLLRTFGAGSAALAVLAVLAWTSARTTLYVVTEQRVVIKTGIALPIFINVPFKQIACANLRVFGDGTGEVSVGLTDNQRIPYLALWPSASPLCFARPHPAIRCVANAREVADAMGRALAEAAGQAPNAPERAPSQFNEPGRVAAALV